MRNKLVLLIGLAVLICSGCSKNETDELTFDLTNDTTIIPSNIEIDIDENGVVDYIIEYYYVLIEGLITSAGIVAVIEQQGENEVLTNKQGSDFAIISLEEIKLDVSEPLVWDNSFGADIVSLYNHSPTNQWRTQWEINSDLQHSSYFVGLKINNDNVSQLAWIEIEIDTSNGNISIIDNGLL